MIFLSPQMRNPTENLMISAFPQQVPAEAAEGRGGKVIFSNMFPTCRSLIYLFKIVMFQSYVSLLKLTSYCQVRKPWQEATTALLPTPHRLVAWRALQNLQDLQDGLGGRKHHPHVQPTHGSKPFTVHGHTEEKKHLKSSFWDRVPIY